MLFTKLTASVLILALIPVWLSLGFLVNDSLAHDSVSFDTIVVFGASVINNQYPSKVLELRLDKAIELFETSAITTIIVSGDTRSKDYDEPHVMEDYLVEHGINRENIKRDVGGSRTLDTCWRLKNIFHLTSVILVTQDFHMPRANYLCHQVGLITKSVTAASSSPAVTINGTLREYPALLYNIGLLLLNYKPQP